MLDYWQHDSSHVCVLVGYDDDCVIVNDPALSEGYRRVAWNAFLAAWAEFDETAIESLGPCVDSDQNVCVAGTVLQASTHQANGFCTLALPYACPAFKSSDQTT